MTRTMRVSAPVALALVVLLWTALPASAATGDPDTTFGGTGKVRTDFAGFFDIARDVLVQPNGRILVAGQALSGAMFDSADFGLARYLDNGDLDGSFSGDGRQQTDFGGGEIAEAVVRQSNGRIVAAGSSSESESRFAVARYGSGGELDTSFSVDGKVRTAFPGYFSANGIDVAVTGDGKVVVVGGATAGTPHLADRGDPANDTDVAIARYKTGGALDGTFGGGDGRVTTDFAGNDEFGSAVEILGSGEFLVAGSSQTASSDQRIVVAKYHENGTLDHAFSGDGKVVANMVAGESEQVAGLVVRPDGKILVGASARNGASGASNADLAMLLLNANGSVALGFGGGDGMVFRDYGGTEDPDAMVRDSTGKLFFVASKPFVSALDPQKVLVFRLNSSGGKDLAYGAAGKATVEFADGVGGSGLAVDSSHRAIAVGRVGIGNDGDFAVIRLQA